MHMFDYILNYSGGEFVDNELASEAENPLNVG